jgi:hypothetical protein
MLELLGSAGLALPGETADYRAVFAKTFPESPVLPTSYLERLYVAHEGHPGHLLHFRLAANGVTGRWPALFNDEAAREGWAIVAEGAATNGDAQGERNHHINTARRLVGSAIALSRAAHGDEEAHERLSGLRETCPQYFQYPRSFILSRVPVSYVRGMMEAERELGAMGSAAELVQFLSVGLVRANTARLMMATSA